MNCIGVFGVNGCMGLVFLEVVIKKEDVILMGVYVCDNLLFLDIVVN